MIEADENNILAYSKKLEKEVINQLFAKAIAKNIIDKYFLEAQRFGNINHNPISLR